MATDIPAMALKSGLNRHFSAPSLTLVKLPFAYTADDKEISYKGEQNRKTASNKDLQQLYSGAVINLKIAYSVGFLIIRAVSGHNHGKLWRMSLQRKAEGRRTYKKTLTPICH